VDESDARSLLKHFGNFGSCEIKSIAIDTDRGEVRIFVHDIYAAPALANLQSRQGAIVFSGVVFSDMLKIWRGERGKIVNVKLGKGGKDDYGTILAFTVLIAWDGTPASYQVRCREIKAVE